MASLGIATGVYVPSKLQSPHTLLRLAEMLKLTAASDIHRAVDVRLVRLGFGKKCTRCGGSGHHSYYPGIGTYCFKCGGEGEFLPTLTEQLCKRVSQSVTDGALEKLDVEERAFREAGDAALALRLRIKSYAPEGFDGWRARNIPATCPASHLAFLPISESLSRIADRFDAYHGSLKEKHGPKLKFSEQQRVLLELRDQLITEMDVFVESHAAR